MTRVLYPGSFDPVHNGHLELIETAAALFDEVVVAAMVNPGKGASVFELDQRQSLLEACVDHLPNVSTVAFSDLVVDLAERLGADLIVKGLRAVADFETEMQMAHTNHAVSGVHTVFLPTAPGAAYISSRFIREIARCGRDVSAMVPPPVAAALQERFSA